MRRTSAETREHVLSIARTLFYRDGIRATGVDAIASSAAIAPTTLYRVFADKDDLVAAYVEREGVLYRDWFLDVIGTRRPATARIIRLFTALERQVAEPECRGCPFQLTLAEVHDSGAAAHRAAVEVKLWVRGQLHQLVTELTPAMTRKNAHLFADQLMLIMEGVYASLVSMPAPGSARQATLLVRSLLATHTAINSPTDLSTDDMK
ncbi:MAG: TetR/AcrR family transcriptional regulator [Nakamurella sp.]